MGKLKKRRRSPVPMDPQSFYREALSQAERLRIPGARQVMGLEEEIALMRVRLVSQAQEHPDSFELLIKGVSLLVRAVATQYRLSPAAQHHLEQSIVGVLDSVGRNLGLGEYGAGPE